MGKPGILNLDLDQKQRTLPEVMYSLSCLSELYEMGLVVGDSIDAQGLYQHILTSMCRVSRATGAGLLLYQPEWQRFVPGTIQNLTIPYHRLISAIDHTKMEELAKQGPGETLVSLVVDQQHICLVTLSCNGILYGVIAFSMADEDSLLDERGMLLSYMGQVAALVLVNYRVHATELQATISQERDRIACDLHDGLAQQLALALLKLEHVQHHLDASSSSPPAMAALASILAEVQGVRQLVEACLNELRHDIASLLPLELERGSFSAALQHLLYTYQEQHPKLTISYHADALECIPSLLEVPVFRLIQEALNNIYKHAQATHVEIRIYNLSGTLQVEVSDNGIGFQPELVNEGRMCGEKGVHIGLYSMRERVQAAGGTWEILSQPGGGTIIRACFPYG